MQLSPTSLSILIKKILPILIWPVKFRTSRHPLKLFLDKDNNDNLRTGLQKKTLLYQIQHKQDLNPEPYSSIHSQSPQLHHYTALPDCQFKQKLVFLTGPHQYFHTLKYTIPISKEIMDW